MSYVYDGCSDVEFKEGDVLCQIYPPDDESLTIIKKFIKYHGLTSEEVRIVKNKDGIRLIAKELIILCALEGELSLTSKYIQGVEL